MKRVITAIGWILCASALLALGVPPIGAQGLKQVKHAYIAEPGYYWDIFEAQELGYFKAEGLDVESVRFDVTSQGMTALATGAVQFASLTPDVPLLAAIKGQGDAIIVSNEVRIATWDFLVLPEITSYADLKGKIIGVSQIQSASTLDLRQLLRRHGLQDSEYTVLQVGGSAKRYAALTSRQIAGALITEPVNFEAMDAGFRKLGGVYEVSRLPSVIIAVLRSWAKANEKTAVGLLRAIYRAQDWLNDTRNRAAAVDLMVKLSKARRSSVERTYDKYVRDLKVYNRGAITIETVTQTLEEMAAIGAISRPLPAPGQFLDLSFRNEAVAGRSGP